jgi:hypothetical protein
MRMILQEMDSVLTQSLSASKKEPAGNIRRDSPSWCRNAPTSGLYRARGLFVALSLLILPVLAPHAAAPPALVQSAWMESVQSATATLQLPSPPTPGNVLVALCGTATAQTLDSISAGWLFAIDESDNDPGLAILYKTAGSADTVGLTIRYSARTRLGLQLLEYSGVDTVTPLQAVSSSSGSDTRPLTASVTTLQAYEMVLAGIVVLTDDPVSGWSGGFDEIANFTTSQPPRAPSTHAAADLLAGTPGTHSTAVTIAGRKARWRGQIAAFNPAPAMSIRVISGTFSFGTQPPDTWLSPESTLVINDGQVTENFLCRLSPFTDGANVWTAVAAYDSDFSLSTGVARGDTVVFWFRLRTPVTTLSYSNHAAGVTITAEAN